MHSTLHNEQLKIHPTTYVNASEVISIITPSLCLDGVRGLLELILVYIAQIREHNMDNMDTQSITSHTHHYSHMAIWSSQST